MGINLTFTSMEDFSPAGVARQVPALKTLLEAREQLANLQRYMDGKVGAEEQLKKLLSDPQMMKALEQRRAEAGPADAPKTEDNE
jgi:type VI secretion system protein ImpB